MSEKDPEELKQQVVELALESQKQGLTTAWFDVVYAQAQGNTAAIPWAKMEAHPMLQNWLARKTPSGTGKKAWLFMGFGDLSQKTLK